MSTKAYIRLQRQEEELKMVLSEMKKINKEVEEALKNDDQEKAMWCYAKHFRLVNEYFIIKNDIANLKVICK